MLRPVLHVRQKTSILVCKTKAVRTDAVGKFLLHGTGGGQSALCYVDVVEANYLENYSFEDKDLSMWTITALKAEPQADFQVKSTDRKSVV